MKRSPQDVYKRQIQENGNDIRIDIEQFCLRMCKAAKSYYDKVHLEKDFSLYNTPVLDFVQVTQKKKAASIIALVCGSERYAKGLKETLQFISDQIMLFYTPESAKTKLGRHKPDLWIVTEDMTSQPNQPWRADRTTPVILITGNPDAVEIKKNSGKLTVLSMPLSIVDLRKTVEIYAVSYTHLDVYKRQIHSFDNDILKKFIGMLYYQIDIGIW